MATIMTSTTLSAAVTATTDQISVASATGVTAGRIIAVDSEFMKVESISALTVKVGRGQLPGLVTAHPSGAAVFVGDADENFVGSDKGGYEASPPHLPVFNINNGKMWINVGGYWYGSDAPQSRNLAFAIHGAGAPTDGTSGTGVNLAGPGATYLDITNALLYINTNTAASPSWTAVGAQTT